MGNKVDLREVSRAKALLAKHGIPVPQELLALEPKVQVTLKASEIQQVERLLESKQVLLTFRKGKLSILTLDRYSQLRDSLKLAHSAKVASRDARQLNVDKGDKDYRYGLLIPTLPKWEPGKGGGYVESLIRLAKKHGKVSIYYSAFTSNTAKNSAAMAIREHGLFTGKEKKGKAQLLVVSVKAIEKAEPIKLRKRTEGVRSGAWTEQIRQAAAWWRSLPQAEGENFQKLYNDGSMSNEAIAKAIGCSPTKVSAVGLGMGWSSRRSITSKFNYEKSQNGTTASAPEPVPA